MVPPASNRVPRVRSYSGATCLDFASLTGILPSSFVLSSTIQLTKSSTSWWSTTPNCKQLGLASFHFARRYFENRFFFLFLGLLRCFSSPRSLRMAMCSPYGTSALPLVGSPIRISMGQGICAPHHSFSQLITSFFGSQCQGIHLMLFFT